MRAKMEGKASGLCDKRNGSGDKTKKTGQIRCERARQTEMDEGDRV